VEKIWTAPAKINLCLHVLGKRADGYHELCMLMQRVSLYDRIRIFLSADPGVRVFCPRLPLATGEENIAARAARKILEFAAYSGGVEIHIDKEIPVAAGLGGGSSDAATVLMAMNELLETGLSREALMAVGLQLGADVPFFIFESAAWAAGIGEKLEKASTFQDVWYLLVNPGFSVSTAQVYGKLQLTSVGDVARLPRFSGTLEDLIGGLHNDLEQVTLRDYPEVAEIRRRMLELGAEGSLMSGSGPTVFGVFREREAARQAARDFSAEAGYKALVVQPV
jgi:4-diphosphocytidyl-2-C-methyl-D-erythritol kinase